jgi:hypothetical protein
VTASAWIAEDRIFALEDLVRWLSMPFGVGQPHGTRPIFAREDPMYASGQDAGEAMARLWAEVTGVDDSVPTPAGYWYKCPECKMWQVQSYVGP